MEQGVQYVYVCECVCDLSMCLCLCFGVCRVENYI